jgi:transmembrane sensor
MALIKKNNSADSIHILLAKYLSKETSSNETAIVETWMEASEANKKYLEQLQLIWTESKKLACERKPDVPAALQKFRERTGVRAKTSITGMRWLKIAAIVLLIVGVAGIIKLTNHSQIKPPDLLKFSAGNIAQSDTLPDGSVVQLQPHAEIICPAQFATNGRNIELKGNAYFSVLHDATRPFHISVNDVKVTVLGTTFNIFDSFGNTEVVVITGIVQVTEKERSMKVFPHERLTVPAAGDLWIKHNDSIPIIQLPQKTSTVKPSSKKADSPVDDYSYHRRVMDSIINDLIKEGLVTVRKSIVWAALTDSELILNGKVLSEAVHQKLKTKYHITSEDGYYYGSVQITGKGYFFNSDDFN